MNISPSHGGKSKFRGDLFLLPFKPFRFSLACIRNIMVPLTAYAKQNGPADLMGDIILSMSGKLITHSILGVAKSWTIIHKENTQKTSCWPLFGIFEGANNGNVTFPRALKPCKQNGSNLWGVWFIRALKYSSVTSAGLQDVFRVEHMSGWILDLKCVTKCCADSGTRHSLQLVVFHFAIWEEAAWQHVGCVRHYCVSGRLLTALKFPGSLNQEFLSLVI